MELDKPKAASEVPFELVSAFVGICFVSGAGVLVYQCYQWLRFSVWVPISIISALQWLEVPWALSPRDWLGLFQLLNFLPLSVALPVIGVIGFLIVLGVASAVDH